MDELAQILSADAGPASDGDVQKDTSSPTGFRNSRGQFVNPDAPKGQPMDAMNPELVQALAGTGSPEQLDQMRRYQMMLQQRPSFAPSMPRAQAAAGAAKVPMDELSAVLAGSPTARMAGGQASQQMPQGMQGMGGPMQPGMSPEDQQTLLQRLRTMGDGLQQLYGPQR